jgi:putative metalloprotease
MKRVLLLGIAAFGLSVLPSCAQLESLQNGKVLESLKQGDFESLTSDETLNVAKQAEQLSNDQNLGEFGKVDIATAIEVGKDLNKAFSLSDEEVNRVAKQAAQHSDSEAELAPEGSSYAIRLSELTNNHTSESGLSLNYKAYLSEDINAFALADGSIRIHSGLMDTMDDEELLSVIGHEVGHVKLGHSKKALQVAYSTAAALKGVASTAQSARSSLGVDLLGNLLKNLINAQYSQSNEKDADEFGLRFMMRHKYNTRASASALRKLAGLGGEHGLLSSHPDPADRAEAIESRRQEYLREAEEKFGKQLKVSAAGAASSSQESSNDDAPGELDYE